MWAVVHHFRVHREPLGPPGSRSTTWPHLRFLVDPKVVICTFIKSYWVIPENWKGVFICCSLLFQDGDCMLNVPEDKPELNHFKDKWMTPQQMIQVTFFKSICHYCQDPAILCNGRWNAYRDLCGCWTRNCIHLKVSLIAYCADNFLGTKNSKIASNEYTISGREAVCFVFA